MRGATPCGILLVGMVAIVQWLGPWFVEPQMRVQFPLATPPSPSQPRLVRDGAWALLNILRDFTSASHEGLMADAHSSPNGSDGPKN